MHPIFSYMLVGFLGLFLEAILHLGLIFGILLGMAALAIWFSGARARVKQLHRWGAVANMYALMPDEFERHVAQTYQALEYQTTVTAGVGDQGIDVVAIRGTEKVGIQCKRTTGPVGNSAVQEAYSGRAHYGCSRAVVIALGGFTTSAKALSTSTGVSLMDGYSYADMFHRARAAQPTRSPWTAIPSRPTVLLAGVLAMMAVFSIFIGLSAG